MNARRPRGTRRPALRPPVAGRAPLLALVLAAAALAGPASPALGAAPHRACSASDPGVVATLGTWAADAPRLDEPAEFPYRDDGQGYGVRGLDSGLGTLAARALAPVSLRAVPVTLRGVRSNGRTVRLDLCHGRRRLARLGPPEPGARVLGVSVNGDRVAWRTGGPGRRGTVTVGRVAAGRVVGQRRTRVPAASRTAVNGRILVMPNGTAAWSFGVRGRPAAWLWPRGRTARRLAVPAGRVPAGDDGWSVRIVDDRHVLLGDTATVLRYGPARPGRCPQPTGTAVDALGPLRLVSVPGGFEGGHTDGSEWTQTLTCDPRVGGYVHAHAYSHWHEKYGDGSGSTPVATLLTAGVLVDVERTYGYGSTQVDAAELTPLATRRSTAARGTVDDPTAADPEGPPPYPGGIVSFVGVRVLPGAVAWVTGPVAPLDDPTTAVREVWLADDGGARIVGRVPAGAPADPALTLSSSAVAWTGAGGPTSVPVRPVPGDVVHSVPTRYPE